MRQVNSEEGFDTSMDNEQLPETVVPAPLYTLNVKSVSPIRTRHPQIKLDIPPYICNQQTIYLGMEYSNTHQIHQILNKQPINCQTRPFIGMNKGGLQFNSFFESGNLDRVDQVGEFEYNLYMRMDTNSKGHSNWFYFKVYNTFVGRIRFNICNFTKAESLYNSGMKPYVLSKKSTIKTYRQQGDNIKYTMVTDQLYCLSFEYQSEFENDEILFATLPPYPYSYMLQRIKKLTKNNKQIVKKLKITCSLAGLSIPVLIVGDQINKKTEEKNVIVVSGRIHPSESNSSWMMQGFLEFILGQSPMAQKLRKWVVFKIIPMMNPDGVVVGNFRNGLQGVDLNRQFMEEDLSILPEVKGLKQLIDNDSNRLLAYFDFHGHQIRKNIFAYGPLCTERNTNHPESKIIPGILQSILESFRMKSCQFGIPKYKTSTARAYANQFVEHLCYTFEASFYGYQKKNVVRFVSRDWINSGAKIAEALYIYMQMKQDNIKFRKSQIPKQFPEGYPIQSKIEILEDPHDSDVCEHELSDMELYEDYTKIELDRLQHQILEQYVVKQNDINGKLSIQQTQIDSNTIRQRLFKPIQMQLKPKDQLRQQVYPDLNIVNCQFKVSLLKSEYKPVKNRARTNSRLLQSLKLEQRKKNHTIDHSPSPITLTVYNYPISSQQQNEYQQLPSITRSSRSGSYQFKKLVTQL